MKARFLTFNFLSFLIIFSSCLENHDNGKEIDEIQIESIDTIEFNYSGKLDIVDYNVAKGQLLLVDKINNDVVFILADINNGGILEKKTLSEILPNYQHEDFKAISFGMNGIGYYLTFTRKVYQFDEKWELKKVIQDKDSELLNYFTFSNRQRLLDFGEGNVSIFGHFSQNKTNAFFTQAEFYERILHLNKINLGTEKFQIGIPFEKHSAYRQGKQFPMSISFFDVSMMDSTIHVIHQYDPTIYIYDWKDETAVLKDTIRLDLDYYELNSDFRLGDNFDILQFSLSSKLGFIRIFEDYTFIGYTKVIDKRKLRDKGITIGDNELFKQFLNDEYRICLQILRNGRKIGKDIVLPKIFGTIQVPISESELFFKPSPINFEMPNDVFFKLKLKEIEVK